jgi:23S rRNA (guanosine2251-2'-O)-methyltransferase
VLKLCDLVTSLPLAPGVESLNASVAAGVLLFEIVRQRTIKA